MDLRERIDPELRRGLDRYLGFIGNGGLHAIADIEERREKLGEMVRKGMIRNPPSDRVAIADRTIPRPGESTSLNLRVYRPPGDGGSEDRSALCYMHAGGRIIGAPEYEDTFASSIAEAVGCIVVSVGYRLAPEHPHPAGVEDCYTALTWMAKHAPTLGIDPQKIALYGRSAGGGLAAGTALLARNRAGPAIAFQLLSYPMLDDRNETSSSHEILDLGIWDRSANIEAWSMALGSQAGTRDVPAYAAPSRASDLAHLPATFIDTGELDLFRDEDVDFATRLMAAGVSTELHVYAGAYHAFDELAPEARVSARANVARIEALQRAFQG